jgi:hypothetical protein
VRTSGDKNAQKYYGWFVGLVYDLRELSGVTTARPGVTGVLHRRQTYTEAAQGPVYDQAQQRRRKWCGMRVGVFYFFSCKIKERIIIEVITLLEYVNKF